SLFRITIENNRFIEKETLFEGVGRIRDVEKGYNGQIYLLFEHSTGGQIVEIIPKDGPEP
ncbi:MAG: PQQ-dependent sugar dehydrogenase, partial [Gammaproteobacteria bacterium]|nr:PQQ-dependent sugar dehydrogenase [Gammaproteobacteria bacterium]